MRGYIDSGILHLTFLFLLFSPLFTGCAAKIIETIPVSPQEETAVLTAFQDMLSNQANCGCCLDAEAEVAISISNWLGERSGTMTGFLQAMQPSYIKFVGVNPLGQPLFVFTTDGFVFQNLQVPKGKVYEGLVQSETFNNYVPAWFEPEYGFYWLTGRIKPGSFEIISIRRDQDMNGFWLQLQYAGSPYRNLFLFDLQETVILRHVLIDSDEKPHTDIQYDDYLPLVDDTGNSGQNKTGEPNTCRWPGTIRVVSPHESGQINLDLHAFLPDSVFSSDDFTIDIPSGFKRVPVQ